MQLTSMKIFKPTLYRLRQRHHQRGLSMIELLLGIALSMGAIIAIYLILTSWDARRRTIATGSNAQISGGVGIMDIERDLKQAGVGFGNVSAATIGCSVAAYNSTLTPQNFNFTLTPVEIIDGASGAADIIRITYGNSAYVANIQQLDASTATTKTLKYRAGFNAGDTILVAGNTPRDCVLYEVTGNVAADAVSIEHTTASYTSFYTGASVTPTGNSSSASVTFSTGEIYDLGPSPQRTEWSVTSAGVLTRRNILRDATAFEVAEGIADLQAQYGVDGSDGSTANGSIEAAEWTNAAPTNWATLLAVRVAILTRSGQLEKESVTPSALTWSGGTFTMRNLDGTTAASSVIANDWHHYRYRVYETVILLRNMTWGATS